MKILATLRESEVYKDNKDRFITPESEYGEPRKAVRIVLFDKDNFVAIGYYAPRDNRKGGYNIPGGGIDEGESIETALVRECREEIGCKIKNVRELGIINEYGVGKSIKHFQENFCFMAEVDGEKHEPEFTELEIKEGLELRWNNLDELIEKVRSQENHFGTRKTLILLEKAREVLNKQ